MKTYEIESKISEHPSNEHFQLHIHPDYEIFLFLEGDTKYIVEENCYELEPGDIIIIRKNTLHRAFHNSSARYRRIIINVQPEFFHTENCPEYEAQFLLASADIGNKINSDITKKSGLYDAFMRLIKYSNNFKNPYTPIVKAIITEILYILNNVSSFSTGNIPNKQIAEIISYINKNFTKNISLDSIEKKFFISKFYLCHVFPKLTGLTVHKYITDKRMALANDMIKNGISKTRAATQAGFKNYSTFYRLYKKYKAI